MCSTGALCVSDHRLQSDEAACFNLLSYTSPVVAFDYKGKVFVRNEAGGERELLPNGIIGLHSARKQFRNDPHTGSIWVLFTETGAGLFFDFPLHELFEGASSLEPFVAASRIARVEEQLAEAATHAERVVITEQFLIGILKQRTPDPLITAATAYIKAANGTLRMKELAQRLNISDSRLEKRFRTVVGASPKKYATIVRVRSAIQNRHRNPSLTSLAHDAGYFDQAHFSRDFKTFTGLTPQQFFNNNDPGCLYAPY